MRKQLDYLFDRDVRSRWRMILVSSLTVAVVGFVAQRRGSTLHEAEIIAAIIGSVMFFAQIGFYIRPQASAINAAPKIGDALVSRAYVFRAIIGFAGSALVAVLASVSASVAQAAILNRRLEEAVQGAGDSAPDSAATAIKVGGAVTETAKNLGVSLNPDLSNTFKRQVTSRLDKRSLQPELQALVESRKWITSEEWLKGIPPELLPGYPGVKQYFTEPTERPQNCWVAITIGSIPPPEKYGVKRCPEFTRFVGEDYPPLPPLDGNYFRNIIFQRVRLIYNGGHVVLENVAFVDCKFDLPINVDTTAFAANVLLRKEITFKKSS